MPLNREALLALDIPAVEQQLEARDILVYALGVGLGGDPMDERPLRFVYEKNLQMLPTMAIVLTYSGPISQFPETGITRSGVVHGEQGFVIHRLMPVSGTLIGKTRVTEVLDKGAAKGALFYSETVVHERGNDAPLCTLTSTTFCRADGGFGGSSGPSRPVPAMPGRAPDTVVDLPTLPQAALIYRLSGDYNPLHIDPGYAKRAGYDRPILHGRCTFGVAGHAILAAVCDYDPHRLVAMEGRFSAPVYPGETIRTELWREGTQVFFRSSIPARGVIVLDNGRARIT